MIWLPQVSTSWVGSAAKANIVVGVVQSLSHVQPFSTPWTAAYQASLSFTISSSLLKFTSIESGMLSNHLNFCHPLLFCLQSSLVSGSFPVSLLFTSGVQSIGAQSASAIILPMNMQGWFPLGLTGLISLQSEGLSSVFSSTTGPKHRFFGSQTSLWSNSHIHAWLREKPYFWLYGPLSAKWCLCFLIRCLGLP